MDNEDFGSLLEQSFSGLNLKFEPGQKLSGVVTQIDSKSVFVDVHSTSEGVIHREELVNKEGVIEEGDRFFQHDSCR